MKHTPDTDKLVRAHGPNVDRIRAALRRAGHDITRRAAGDRWRALQLAAKKGTT